MRKLLWLAALCLATVTGLPRNNRIVNGSFTSIGQYPFLAGVLLAHDGVNFINQCGGAIINNRSILSAAHCFIAASQTRIRVGSTLANSGGFVHNAGLIIPHPEYNSFTEMRDIGLIRVTTPFSFGTNVQVGRLAGPNYNLGGDQAVWAVGWGRTSSAGSPSEQLLHVPIRTLSESSCAALVGSIYRPYMVCAGGGGYGVCSGDSGGPLVQNNDIVVGVVSFGPVPCASSAAVFIRVSHNVNWIDEMK